MKQKKFTPEGKEENRLMSSSKKYKIILTTIFQNEAKRLAKKYPHIKEDFLRLRDQLKEDPITGNDALFKNMYKVRMPITDKVRGQSGGARVIIQVKIIDRVVYVISVYDKSEMENLTEEILVKLLLKSGLK